MSQTLAQLQNALRREDEIVPAGWLTAREWQKKWNLGPAQTRERLRDLVEDEEFKLRNFRIWSGQRLYPVPHYRKRKNVLPPSYSPESRLASRSRSAPRSLGPS